MTWEALFLLRMPSVSALFRAACGALCALPATSVSIPLFAHSVFTMTYSLALSGRRDALACNRARTENHYLRRRVVRLLWDACVPVLLLYMHCLGVHIEEQFRVGSHLQRRGGALRCSAADFACARAAPRRAGARLRRMRGACLPFCGCGAHHHFPSLFASLQRWRCAVGDGRSKKGWYGQADARRDGNNAVL